jgi:hypothetical protein
LAAGLAALPLGVLSLLWLSGSLPFAARPQPRRAPAGLLGEVTHPSRIARAPTVVGDGGADELDQDGDGEGDVPWIRDPDGLQPVLPGTCPSAGDCVLDFPFHDEQLLQDTHTHGGRVWVPDAAREEGGRFPLVVLLHGTDTDEPPDPPHRLLAPPLDLSLDFKRAMDRGHARPVLVAAPSQTRRADASPTLWTEEGFDLVEFVRVLDRELAARVGRVQVDRRAVSVFGHSGAGCVATSSKRNGLFQVAEQVDELARQGVHLEILGLMDICFHGYGGGRFLRKALEGSTTRVWAMWVEPETWFTSFDRDLDGFATGMRLTRAVPCNQTRYESCAGDDRGWWLFKARRDRLEHLPADQPDEDRLDAHRAVTRWFVQEALRRHFASKDED